MEHSKNKADVPATMVDGYLFWGRGCHFLAPHVCGCRMERRTQILLKSFLGMAGACTVLPFLSALCCFRLAAGLQFTLQSLVTSPPQVCPADLAAWCPQDRETVTKEVAPVCPVSPGCRQAWLGPPISTHCTFPFSSFQTNPQAFSKTTSAHGSLRPLTAARCRGLTL